MLLVDVCNRDVVIAERNTSVPDAAKLMRAYHAGDLIIVDQGEEGRYPVGILTDRDLVVGVLAENAERAAELTVADVMTRNLITLPETKDVSEALEVMRSHGIRRIPVVGAGGVLVGVISFDDIVELIAGQMSNLAQLLAREQRHEKEVLDGIEAPRETRH